MKDGAATRQIMLSTSMSEQLFETSDCKACIFNNSAHRDRVHRIVSWNGDGIGCGSIERNFATGRFANTRDQ